MNFTTLSKKVSVIVYARLLPLCAMLLSASVVFGQAPPNDNACQAIVLTPDATCTFVQGTNLNATNSSGVAEA